MQITVGTSDHIYFVKDLVEIEIEIVFFILLILTTKVLFLFLKNIFPTYLLKLHTHFTCIYKMSISKYIRKGNLRIWEGKGNWGGRYKFHIDNITLLLKKSLNKEKSILKTLIWKN